MPDHMHRISANVYLTGSEVRVLEVLCDAALHLVLGPRVQVLVSKPHPTQQQEAWLTCPGLIIPLSVCPTGIGTCVSNWNCLSGVLHGKSPTEIIWWREF